jgi:hypothetical protein
MEIICRDFERMWNELIDEGSPLFRRQEPGETGRPTAGTRETDEAAAGRERALLDHAASCRSCGQVALRYQVLGRALRAWGPPPDAPAGLADRILAAVATHTLPRSRQSTGTARARRFWRVGLPMAAAAAAIAAAITVGLLSQLVIEPAGRILPGPSAAKIPAPIRDPDGAGGPMLNTALADATDATWDLARSASEPAARISRQVFDAAISLEGTPAQPRFGGGAVPESVTGLSLDALAYDSAAAVATLQQVGDHLASGVKPLSSTARQAFGFLLGPARPKPEVRAQLPAARGA